MLPPLPVETICRPSVQHFATLGTPFQRPTYPPSGAPPSPSLAPLSSPTPNKLSKHHLLWQTTLPHTCHESHELYIPFAHGRLYALISCLG